MRVLGYARVSSESQDLGLQKEAIQNFCKYRGLELVRLFEDKASGKNTERPGFRELMAALENNPLQAEAVVIHKLDRIGRSIRDLLYIADFLKSKNIGLISITNNIDTTIKEGRLFFYIMGAIAEYERELIEERVKLGREAAKEKGVKFGRPKKNIPVDEIRRLLAEGVPKSEIARKFKVHRTTIYMRLGESQT